MRSPLSHLQSLFTSICQTLQSKLSSPPFSFQFNDWTLTACQTTIGIALGKITHNSQYCHHWERPRCNTLAVWLLLPRGKLLSHEVFSCQQYGINIMTDAGTGVFIKGTESQGQEWQSLVGDVTREAIYLQLHCVPYSRNLLPITEDCRISVFWGLFSSRLYRSL